MKISFLNRIVSFLMVFVVLFSTLSFTIESHYCGSHLVDTAIFTKAKKCGIESVGKVPIKKSCCKDEVEVVKGQNELKTTDFNDLQFSQQLFFTTYVYTYLELFESLPKQVIPHKNYSPPNLILDIQVVNDTFLI